MYVIDDWTNFFCLFDRPHRPLQSNKKSFFCDFYIKNKNKIKYSKGSDEVNMKLHKS